MIKKYILKRMVLMILTMTIIVIVVFFLLQLVKGFPKAIEDKIARAEKDEQIVIINKYTQKESVNPILAFVTYLQKLFQGDFGEYYAGTQTIPQLFIKPLKYTLMITAPSFFIGTFFGIVSGFIAGYKRGKWQDVTVNIIATFFVSVPSFVLATFFILFGNEVGLPISFTNAQLTGRTLLAVILPITIISITSFSTLTYYIRNEVVEVLISDYVSIARAKGLSETQIFFKHVLKNVSLPFITIVFPSFLWIVFGSFIVEIFFSVPGSSSIFTLAITQREKNLVMFSTLFFTAFALLVQLFVDVLYVIFDPRITLGEKSNKENSFLKKVQKLFLHKRIQIQSKKLKILEQKDRKD